MAIRFNNSNLTGVDYNLYNIDKFNGVDYTTTPTLVDDSRAIEISNYLPKGNSLVKRYGTKMVSEILINKKPHTIFNIWEDPKNRTNGLKNYFLYVAEKFSDGYINPAIIVANNLTDNDAFDYDVHYTLTNYNYGSPKLLSYNDMYSYGICFEGKLFILCYGNYLMTDFGLTLGVPSKIVRVDSVNEAGVNYAYTPTIILGLGDIKGTSLNTFNEEFNLLSNKCKLELLRYDYDEEDAVNTRIKYYDIDQFFSQFASFKITAINNVLVKNDKEEVVIDLENGTYLDGVGTVRYKFYESQSKKLFRIDNKLNGTNEDELLSEKYVTLEIEFERKEKADLVQNMRFGISYGSYGHRDRLFLSGNPNYPNLDIHSCETNDIENGWKDYTYFGDSSYALIGNSETAIKGYGLLNNGSMAIFKESQSNTSNLYFRTYEMSQDSDGNYKERFPITVSGLSTDVTVEGQIIGYNNDLLVNTSNGIYKIMAGESTATQTYNSVEMSYFLRENLGSDISEATSIVFKNKLYVSRKDLKGKKRIYVADYNRYSFVDGKQVYEWFVLDDIDVVKFFVIDDELYYSNEKGLFKLASDIFEDSWFFTIQDSNINGETFSKDVFVDAENDNIILSSTNDAIQRIISSENLAESWQDFKEKTKIKFGNWFCIDRPNEYVYSFQIGSQYSIANFKFGGEPDYFTPTLLNTLILNCKENGDSEQESYPRIICERGMYVVLGATYEEDGYTLQLVPANGEEGKYVDIDPTVVSLCLNCKKQHFSFDINEIYHANDEALYPLSRCTLDENQWYWSSEDNLEYLNLGSIYEVFFNHISLKIEDFPIDFTSLHTYNEEDGNKLREVVLTFHTPVSSYWRSKFNAFGRLDYLKTIDRTTFVADAVRGGKTEIGYRTTFKKSNSQVGFLYKNEIGIKSKETNTQSALILKEKNQDTEFVDKHQINFNDIDFSYFTFSSYTFAQTFTAKKKIKNFSFVQLTFESNDPKDSTIVSLSLRYKYTRNNKGVK